MNSSPLGFGIVGTGMIAGVLAEALSKAKNARLIAVSSRRLENAASFVAKYPGAIPVQGTEALLNREDVEAIYIATPTVAKEAIALAAIAAGKHVLVEKPFIDRASVSRMTNAAAVKGVVFMDATHFVHHPRTAAIQGATAEKIGSPRSLHTSCNLANAVNANGVPSHSPGLWRRRSAYPGTNENRNYPNEVQSSPDCRSEVV